jgi:prophage regulatory protein
MSCKIMRVPSVLAERGIGRATHYAHIKAGLWTRPIALGARAVGWPEREVDALNAARIAGKSDAEIRCLVEKLEADRRLAA